MSLLKTALLTEPDSRFTLFYGNRDSHSVIFLEELARLKNRFMDRLQVHHFLAEEAEDIDLFNGMLDRAKCDEILEHLVDPAEVAAFFICGPGPMMDAAEEALLARGVATRQDPSRALHRRPPVGRDRGADAGAAAGGAGPDDAGHARRPQAPRRLRRRGRQHPRQRPRRRACRRPSPARPASAPPAARGSSRARSRWRRATASPTRRWRRATSSPASRCPKGEGVELDYDA